MNTTEDFFDGPVDVDETFVGGKRRNMHADKRMEMDGRGVEAKAIVAGIKDRHSNQVAAMKIDSIDTDTMQPFLAEHVEYDAKVYTDDARDYEAYPSSMNQCVIRSESTSRGRRIPTG